MTFSWQLYVEFAGKLLVNTEESDIKEAYFRSSLSRSYYGVYGIACIYLLEERGISSIPRINSHKWVHDKFGSYENERAMRKVSENLKNLWKERKDADYQRAPEINKNRAEAAYLLAKDTIEIFESVSSI